MYHSYFGLKEAPFSIAVNPRYLYMSPSHRDALAHLLYGVGAGGGFIVLTGEVGTGKTTINRCLIEQLPENADIAIVLNPALDARDLLATVCDELGIDVAKEPSGLKVLTDALHRFLLANHTRGRKTVLMIDEAQHLDFDVLEQIRLLTNLETDEEKLLHIILIGQPELAERLSRPELRQLNQRITARYDLSPLTRDETAAYIRHRLHVAGLPAGRQLFDARLVRAIHRESDGVPRLINLLCDRLLLGAYGRNQERPDRRLLRSAAREVLGESGGGRSAPGPSSWQLPVLALGAVVLVVAALFALLDSGKDPVEPADTAAERDPARAPVETVARLPGTGGVAAEPAVDAASRVEADGNDGTSGGEKVAVPAQPIDAMPRWFLSPEEGGRLLAVLYGVEVGEDASDPCLLSRQSGVACVRDDDLSWSRLRAEARPALLELLDERRFEGRALFLGVEGEAALIGTAGGIAAVPVAELGASWTGAAWRLWQPPLEIGRTLSRGDRGEDVAALAALFARYDGQARPLAGELFDARLEERVRLFQREQGLVDDGVLGERTLRALVLAAGADLDLTAARARLREQLAARETP